MNGDDTIIVSVGGVWEGSGWEVQFNVETSTYRSKYNRMVNSVPGGQWSAWGAEPCPHGFDLTEEDVKHYPADRPFGGEESWDQSRNWKVPRVAVQYNESGYSSTGICLDCIVEWATVNPQKASGQQR